MSIFGERLSLTLTFNERYILETKHDIKLLNSQILLAYLMNNSTWYIIPLREICDRFSLASSETENLSMCAVCMSIPRQYWPENVWFNCFLSFWHWLLLHSWINKFPLNFVSVGKRIIMLTINMRDSFALYWSSSHLLSRSSALQFIGIG